MGVSCLGSFGVREEFPDLAEVPKGTTQSRGSDVVFEDIERRDEEGTRLD